MIFPEMFDGEDKSSPFKNRLRKNYKHIRKWAKRTQTNAFRLYDREIKEFPLTIDFYAGRFYVQFFSYEADEEEPREDLREAVEHALSSLFGSPQELYYRLRYRRKKTEQYEKQGEQGEFFIVYEYGVPFYVNLTDYLDTGLFLDHRETRQKVAALAPGKRVLNLFAYTCAFSVHAALRGAASTTSVDLSNTYTAWGEKNFHLNQIPLKNHTIIRADCLKFLEEQIGREQYDLIVVDPPTLSRSKKMDQLFDVQEDYVRLLQQALHLLAPGGTLFFSTNARKFKFDPSHFPNWEVRELQTLPLDFHQQNIHYCWTFSK